MSIGSWWDKNVKKPINNLGQTISQGTRKVTDTIGLTTPQIPDDEKLKLDPTKAAALAGYQNTVGQNASRWGTNAPGGQGYFTPTQYTPTLPEKTATPTSVRETDMTYTPQTSNVPTEQQSTDQAALLALSKPNYGQTNDNVSLRMQNVGQQNIQVPIEQGQINLGRAGGVVAPGTIAKSSAENQQLNTNFNQMLPNRASEASMLPPSMPMEGQTNLGLGKVAQYTPDTQQYDQTIRNALQERVNTQANTTQGYDPQQKELALQQMTRGLDEQQASAEADLKEQLSKAGILGSSVGASEMAKLKQKYDEQKANALTTVNLQNLEAQRQDRYTNSQEENNRLAQIASLSSTGQGLGVQTATTKAGLTAQDNAAISQEADSLQKQRGIDRDTAMQLATYNREGRNIDANSDLTRAQFNQGAQQAGNAAIAQNAQTATANRLSDEQLALQKAGFTREGINADNSAALQEAQFGQGARATNLTNAMNLENMNRQGISQNNANALTQANFDVQQGNTAYQRQQGESDAEFNRRMATEEYGRQGRQIDTTTAQNLANTNFNQGMQVNEFNRQGRGVNTNQDWATYNAQNADALNRANTLNQGQQYNLGRGDTAKSQEYQSYINDLNRQGEIAGGDMYTPESEASAAEYAARQDEQQKRLGATMGLTGAIATPTISAIGKKLAGKIVGVPETAQASQPVQPQVKKNKIIPSVRR